MQQSTWTGGKTGPRYVEVANQIAFDVEAGRYPVGSLIPAESAIMGDFGVSRHTARAAIRKLQDWGMILTRQGRGSEVVAIRPLQSGIAFSFDSLNDFLLLAQETRLDIISRVDARVDAEMAKLSGWREDDPCLFISANRVAEDVKEGVHKIAYVELYLHGRYKRIEPEIGNRRYAIARQIEEAFGIEIRELRQKIMPTHLHEEASKAMGVPKKTMGLRIERVYVADNNDVPFVVISHQAGDDAVVEMRMRYQ